MDPLDAWHTPTGTPRTVTLIIAQRRRWWQWRRKRSVFLGVSYAGREGVESRPGTWVVDFDPGKTPMNGDGLADTDGG